MSSFHSCEKAGENFPPDGTLQLFNKQNGTGWACTNWQQMRNFPVEGLIRFISIGTAAYLIEEHGNDMKKQRYSDFPVKTRKNGYLRRYFFSLDEKKTTGMERFIWHPTGTTSFSTQMESGPSFGHKMLVLLKAWRTWKEFLEGALSFRAKKIGRNDGHDDVGDRKAGFHGRPGKSRERLPPVGQVQFVIFEKITSAYLFQITREESCDSIY